MENQEENKSVALSDDVQFAVGQNELFDKDEQSS